MIVERKFAELEYIVHHRDQSDIMPRVNAWVMNVGTMRRIRCKVIQKLVGRSPLKMDQSRKKAAPLLLLDRRRPRGGDLVVELVSWLSSD